MRPTTESQPSHMAPREHVLWGKIEVQARGAQEKIGVRTIGGRGLNIGEGKSMAFDLENAGLLLPRTQEQHLSCSPREIGCIGGRSSRWLKQIGNFPDGCL